MRARALARRLDRAIPYAGRAHHALGPAIEDGERTKDMSAHHPMPLWASALLTLAVISIAMTACSSDDDDSSSTTTPEETASSTTSSTQPAGTEPSDVEPYITELLARYDEVTNQIVADPSVATDRSHPLIKEYLALIEPGSDAEGAIQTWIDNAAEGITIRPYSDDAPPFVTSLDGSIETISADEVRFPTCEQQNYRQYDGQGRQTEFVTGQPVPGQGTAVRVDGEWRLRRLDIVTNAVGCGSSET
jgi:hypothetical protein